MEHTIQQPPVDTEREHNPEDGYNPFDLENYLCADCGEYHTNPGDGNCIPLTCHSCARPTTEDESVVVRPSERVCIPCIKAGKVTNPEPEQDESDEGGMWPADWTETR